MAPIGEDQEPGGGSPDALRADLGPEYAALVRAVADFDGRLMVVKGWSVTLSLAGLGLGFQQGHYALFGLAAVTAAAFWVIDFVMKRQQMRYYPRMRDIEVAAYELNSVALSGGRESSPRIDWSWSHAGADDRRDPPRRRQPDEVRKMLAAAFWQGHVMLPHLLAIVLGVGLFVAAALGLPALSHLVP